MEDELPARRQGKAAERRRGSREFASEFMPSILRFPSLGNNRFAPNTGLQTQSNEPLQTTKPTGCEGRVPWASKKSRVAKAEDACRE